jgi:hypothetical protein
MNDEKIYGMMDYSFCPITQKCCVEQKCAWWLDIKGQGGCAIRCLGSLVEGGIAKLLINAIYGKYSKQG